MTYQLSGGNEDEPCLHSPSNTKKIIRDRGCIFKEKKLSFIFTPVFPTIVRFMFLFLWDKSISLVLLILLSFCYIFILVRY